jgi:hypothetical protein
MRLFGITMLRNEADIVEACIRHNLTLLILAGLQREGLPLRVVRDANPAFFQAERMTSACRIFAGVGRASSTVRTRRSSVAVSSGAVGNTS